MVRASLMFWGREFHRQQPLKANVFLPKPLTTGRAYLPLSSSLTIEQSLPSPTWQALTLNLVEYWWTSLIGLKYSPMYKGALLKWILKTWVRIIWYILLSTGNQPSSVNCSRPIWDLESRPKTNLINLFWVTCNLYFN